jgi:hypothetical protein
LKFNRVQRAIDRSSRANFEFAASGSARETKAGRVLMTSEVLARSARASVDLRLTRKPILAYHLGK